MNKIASLKKEYVTVIEKNSFGGSQNYFSARKSVLAKGKVSGGCGVVALADTIAYLMQDTSFETVDSYCRYFDRISRGIFFVATKIGMSFIHMHLGSFFLFKKYGLKYKLRWVFRLKKLYPRVKQMLDNNIPAILCIPRLVGPNKAKRGLPLYHPETLNAVTRTSGHFVVITGILEDGDRMYFEISSWGMRYLIEYGEFVKFVRKTPVGLLGHMLYIK